MLMLLFRIGDSCYALDTQSVLEVIPKVELAKIHGTSSVVAGLINYQGCIVPVLSLSQLLKNTTTKVNLSSRIILLNHKRDQESSQLLGLLAEHVTETIDRTPITHTANNTLSPASSYVNNIFLQQKEQQEMIQYLQIDRLLSQQEYTKELSKIGIPPMG